MERLKTYRIDASKSTSSHIYVTLDKETVELRRKGSRTVDEFCVELELQEAYQLSAVLLDLLPKAQTPPVDTQEPWPRDNDEESA